MNAAVAVYAVFMATVVLALVGCGLMLVHNQRVFRFRRSMLDSIHRASTADVYARRDWRWRYEAFNQVTYDQMMRRPWKRLRPESWYDDTSFLRAGAR